MVDENEHDKATAVGAVVKHLMQQTGISEPQAKDLVNLIGNNWSSLLREARFLRGTR